MKLSKEGSVRPLISSRLIPTQFRCLSKLQSYRVQLSVLKQVNNGEAGDLRRHRAHYDVSVMQVLFFFRRQAQWSLMSTSRTRCRRVNY